MIFIRVIFRIIIGFLRPPWGILILLTGIIIALCSLVGKEYSLSFFSQEIARNTGNNKNITIRRNKRQLPQTQNDEIEKNLLVTETYSTSNPIDDSKIHTTYLTPQTLDKPNQIEKQYSQSVPPKLPQEFPLKKNELASLPRVGFYSLPKPSESFIHEKPQELIARQEPIRSLPQQNPSDISPFLDSQLQMVTIENLPKLPTQDLMRLLNHTNWEISQQSEEILKTRDSFQDEQIRLAAALYHPNPNVRKSLLPQLASDEQLEIANWLIELLKDPDDDVRWTTASAICSQKSFSLDAESLEYLKNMIQADANTKIATLARRLESLASADQESTTTR
ncbi:MAG: HEAT repeat domain-containing protein [Planctomycetaceae bacterium]|jgi:hypothetical protein|nr:HEAT repeat domain-containing protein [Planctomycetaceae bacterium]